MANVPRALREAWSENPRKWVDLIVHVSGDVNEHISTLNDRGCKVTRIFRLTRSIGVHCTGRMALELLEKPWVTKVEPDRPVKALER